MKLSVAKPELCKENLQPILTVLHRSGGKWDTSQVNQLVNGLNTHVAENSDYPEFLVLRGSFTKKVVVEALGGRNTITVTRSVGTHGFRIPFVPLFD